MTKRGKDVFRDVESNSGRAARVRHSRDRINKKGSGSFARMRMRVTVRRGGIFLLISGILVPVVASAQTTADQGVAGTIEGLQGTLDTVFHSMLGMCGS